MNVELTIKLHKISLLHVNLAKQQVVVQVHVQHEAQENASGGLKCPLQEQPFSWPPSHSLLFMTADHLLKNRFSDSAIDKGMYMKGAVALTLRRHSETGGFSGEIAGEVFSYR